MQKRSTGELDKELENMRIDQLDSYYEKNEKYMYNGSKAFYYHMKDVLDAKRIKLKDVYSFAGVTESYGSQIIRMEKHTRDRDLILRLCIAGHFSLDETNRALKLYGMSELYAKEKRDACIIVAVNNRIYDLYDIDEMLSKRGLKKITPEEHKYI